MRDYNKEDFLVRYPGVYDEKEKKYLEQFWEEAERINKRGPIDIQALISGTLPKDTPGIGPVINATKAMIKYNHSKYEQENPLYNDEEYAKKAGYLDIPAYFVYAAHDDAYTSAFPEEARDTLLVSQACHHIDNFNVIYAGDKLFLTFDEREMVDITPKEGSVYRSVALYNAGTIYNQRGEIVNKVSFHYVESLKTYKPEKRPKDFGARGFADIWEDPDWFSKEDHYYTDKDYEYFKNIWRHEKIQGATPLYWEDIQIGDEPAKTLEGPIIECALPAPFGQGIGGTRTMKKEILDEAIFKTMIRDKHGIYKLPNIKDYTPEIPDGARPAFNIDDGREAELNEKLDLEEGTGVDTADIHSTEGDERAAIINFYGRDLAIHHISNWMGDAARFESISWSIMPPETHAAYGKPVPTSPYFVHWLEKAPKMKDKTVNTHGLTRDTAEISSVVIDKYTRNGKYLVKLIWWINDVNGNIWIDGCAEVEFPHKN